MPANVTLILLPSRAPELNRVENIWQYMRANWLSNCVFETYDAITDAACEAWQKLTAQPQIITSNWFARLDEHRSSSNDRWYKSIGVEYQRPSIST